MLEGATLPAWVMQLVLPAATRPAGDPTKRQFGAVRGVPTIFRNNGGGYAFRSPVSFVTITMFLFDMWVTSNPGGVASRKGTRR